MNGVLLVDKPVGWSSMDVVRRVRRTAGGVKTGHAGTLDPLASGLLICCLGRATKAIPTLMDLKKVYRATIDFSGWSATDDLEGPIEAVACHDPPDQSVVGAMLKEFVGWIDQSPPAFSAVHVGGQRAYKLARKGVELVLPSRKVFIESVELHHYIWPAVTIMLTCGKGTYVRSLARDLGKRLGTGGYLTGLQRLATGPFLLENAVKADEIRGPIREGDLIPTDTLIKMSMSSV